MNIWARVTVKRLGTETWGFVTPQGDTETFRTRQEARDALKLLKKDAEGKVTMLPQRRKAS